MGIISGIIDAESGRQDDAHGGFTDGTSVTLATLVPELLAGSPGSLTIPSTTALDPATAGAFRGYAGDFYYRIWAVPLVLRASNPRIGSPIPFHLWNAYPEANTLTAIGSTGAGTLSLDITAPTDFRAIEYRQVDLTILNNTVVNIDADYTFTFTEGETPFTFLATVIQFIGLRPDVPVQETWEWLTDVLRAFNGNEQRSALRTYPRKTITYQLLVDSEDQRREQYDRWYRSVGFDLMIPAFQYGGFAQQDAAIGDSNVYLNMENIDIRDGESGIFLDPFTESSFFVTVVTAASDHIELQAPLAQFVPKGMIFAPVHRSRVPDKTGVAMQSVTGKVSVTAQVFDDRTSFPRPTSTATITTLAGYNVLDRRPLANDDVQEFFERGFETLDNTSGLPDIKRSWLHAFVQGTRKFLLHRELDPTEMDFWRDFCNAVNGQQNPFLMSSYRKDLQVAVLPDIGGATLTIVEGRYVDDYWPFETYKYLEFETDDGSILRAKVQTATLNGDGTADLVLSDNFGTSVNVVRISFLNVVRMNSDIVQLEHDHIDTTITLQLRAIDR